MASIDLTETMKKKKKTRRKCSISHHLWGTVSSSSTGPVNNQQHNSQGLSSEITVMAVCLTSTVTSALLLLLFFSLSLSSKLFPCDQGWETQYPQCTLFSPGRHGNTKKHEAVVVNEIPACHQSLADKDAIVVVFE